jgi:hypothetical protein
LYFGKKDGVWVSIEWGWQRVASAWGPFEGAWLLWSCARDGETKEIRRERMEGTGRVERCMAV